MNFKDGDHLKFDEVYRKVKQGEKLSREDRELILDALANTSENAYWSTGGRR